MPRRFLPSLRREPTPPATPAAQDTKAVLDEYYAALASAGLTGSYRSKPWPIERAVEEGYERVIWCFKAVDAIAGNAARLAFLLREDREVVDDHPLYRLLNDGKANPLETGRQFRKRLSAQVLLSKTGAFVEVTTTRGGEPKRMDLLPPGRTRIIPGTGRDPIDHFQIIRADGTRRDLDPRRVRWFRDPHPIDPYSGTTPLEAAGLSIELDYFARAYNATFMRNDGRPGGILGVKGDMSEPDMDRIESRFGKGPAEAGKLSVVNGELSYQDLASTPRDAQYRESQQTTKEEILAAFGTPESVFGYASDRTYANAEQELHNFWTVTMPQHLALLLTGLDEDSDDDLTGDFDTSDVEVLQRAKAQRREEARTEFEAGLITPDEYREEAGWETVDSPFTRALYVPTGKTPIPTRKEDREALGMAPAESGQPQVGTETEPQRQVGAAAGADDDGAQPAAEEEEGGAGQQPPGGGGSSPPPGGDGASTGGGRTAREAVEAALAATKTLPPLRAPALRIDPDRGHRTAATSWETVTSDVDMDQRNELETQLAAALNDVARRMVDRTVARLQSPKTRKHTRHFTAEYPVDSRVGVKAVDAARAVDEQRWREEAEQQTRPLLDAAATAAAAGLLGDLGLTAAAGGVAVGAAVVAAVLALILASAERQAQLLIQLISDVDATDTDLAGMVASVRVHADQLDAWAEGLAQQAATATVAGGRDEAAAAAAEAIRAGRGGGGMIVREWRSRRDQRVRPTHVVADGQRRPLGEVFTVGGAELRFPGDPLGPWSETANCRCRLRYALGGRYVPRPAGEPAENTQGRGEPELVAS